jgi:gamma-glutamyltranspeptidase
MRKLITLAFLALVACSTSPQTGTLAQDHSASVPGSWPFPLQVTPTVAPSAMVATDAPLATQVGVQVMRDGGNAVDAAVATAFALAVVYPEAGNI